jgi:protein-S-isoprenylcysteine O-methyltransferase Ste14
MGHVTDTAGGEQASRDPADRRSGVPLADLQRRIGWVLVAAQVALLVAFVAAPKRRGLLSPPDVLDILGILLMVAGLATVLIGLLSLGAALTPTPVPVEGAGLRKGGIYSLVRHPIYVGILMAALGFTLAVGSLWQVLLWVALAVFFYAKAFWEDRLLAERHGVPWFDYADHVGGFIPRFWGSR